MTQQWTTAGWNTQKNTQRSEVTTRNKHHHHNVTTLIVVGVNAGMSTVFIPEFKRILKHPFLFIFFVSVSSIELKLGMKSISALNIRNKQKMLSFYKQNDFSPNYIKLLYQLWVLKSLYLLLLLTLKDCCCSVVYVWGKIWILTNSGSSCLNTVFTC